MGKIVRFPRKPPTKQRLRRLEDDAEFKKALKELEKGQIINQLKFFGLIMALFSFVVFMFWVLGQTDEWGKEIARWLVK